MWADLPPPSTYMVKDIKMLNKSKFKNMVKQKIVSRALEKLEEKKESH